MNANNEFWALIFIGGYLLFLEGGIVLMARSINNRIPEYWMKIFVGVIIIITAIIGLSVPLAPFIKPPAS